MNIQEFSKEVVQEKYVIEHGPNIPVMLDPASIALIASLTIKLAKCLYNRYGKNAESIKENIQNPGLLDTIGLKRAVFAALGWRRYRKEGDTVIQALIKTGGKLTLEDLHLLIKEGL
jgi:hypothetical protein